MSLLVALLVILPAVVLGQAGLDTSLQPYNLTATALFITVDTDLSGDIDMREMMENFRQYDVDHNNRVSRTEYNNYVDAHVPHLRAFHDALFDIYDVDNDHILDRHDYENFYNLMDGNGNGNVTHFEFMRYWTILLETLEHLHAGKKK